VTAGAGVDRLTDRVYLIGYTAFCTLRIIAGTPRTVESVDVNVDAFHLSILSALAHRLCQLRVHPNIGSISKGLGFRLLNAARKIAAMRLATVSIASSKSADDIVAQLATAQDIFDHALPVQARPSTSGGFGCDMGDFAFSFDFSHLGEPFATLDQTDSGAGQASGLLSFESMFGMSMPFGQS